jgi:hypothetical protein
VDDNVGDRYRHVRHGLLEGLDVVRAQQQGSGRPPVRSPGGG